MAAPGQQGCPDRVVTTHPGQEGVAESVEACPEGAVVGPSGQKRAAEGRAGGWPVQVLPRLTPGVRAGILAYNGTEALAVGKGLYAIPLGLLLS